MKRNAYFDNAKLLLIFLVVFGHIIQPLANESTSIGTLYTWIYTFHMPAFIFLSGFFAKGSGSWQYVINLAKKLLVPYLIFQILYTAYYFLIGKTNWTTEHIFYPHWSLWFLLSLFCWHILLILYKKIPAYLGLTVAIIIGVIVGYFDTVEQLFSLSRTFVFFPFFLLGFHVKPEHIRQLKHSVFRWVSPLILISVAVVIHYLPDVNIGWFFASQSYTSLELDYLGGLARLLVYGTSTIMAVAILVWIPGRRFSFTYLGERTLYVYLLHGFFIQYFRELGLFQATNFFALIGLAFLSAAIVYLLSSRIIVTLAQPLIEVSYSRLQRSFEKLKHSITV